MGLFKHSLDMYVDDERVLGFEPKVDVNNKHVVPILWTAILHAKDLLFEKDLFEFVHLTSHLFGEVLSDPGYHRLVEYVREYDNDGEPLPAFLVYDPVLNTREVIYAQWSLSSMFRKMDVNTIPTAEVIRYGKTTPDYLYLPISFREGKMKLALLKGDDVFKIRGKLMNTFFKYAPFGIYPFPSSFNKANFGLKKRAEVKFDKNGKVLSKTELEMLATMKRNGVNYDKI